MSALASAQQNALADAGPRRPRAGDALGAGLAAGDRPRAVRRAADEARRDGRARRPRSPASSTRRWPPRSARTRARRSSTSRSTTSSGGRGARGGPELPDPAGGPAPDGDALERAVALLRDAERPVIMAGTNLYWGHGERALLALAEELRIPVFLNGLARGCVPADHELFFSRARGDGAQGRRRRARRRRPDGLPPRLRAGVRRGDRDRGARPRRARHASTRAPVAAELYGGVAATLDALREGARGGAGHARVGRAAARRGARAPRGRGGRARRRPRAAAPDAALPRAGRGARPRRDRHRRRRRLRLLRRARHRLLRAGLLAGPGSVRLPGLAGRATRWRPSSPGRSARSCCCSATARSASAGWSSTRSPATASTSSASWATTGSGRWRSTRWSSSTATPSPPSCGPARATTRSSRRSAATASSSSARRTCSRRSSARSRRGGRHSSTC